MVLNLILLWRGWYAAPARSSRPRTAPETIASPCRPASCTAASSCPNRVDSPTSSGTIRASKSSSVVLHAERRNRWPARMIGQRRPHPARRAFESIGDLLQRQPLTAEGTQDGGVRKLAHGSQSKYEGGHDSRMASPMRAVGLREPGRRPGSGSRAKQPKVAVMRGSWNGRAMTRSQGHLPSQLLAPPGP